jgi:hypothetical protein
MTTRQNFSPAQSTWGFPVLVLLAVVLAACGGSSSAPVVNAHTGTTCPLLPAESPPSDATSEFKTDFSKHCVHYREILSGGPSKDGIPALDHPKFVSVKEANAWLKPVEPVIFFQVGSDARAYPIQILIWHEIVNDTVGGVPVAITFCPLCNTAIAYERTVQGAVLDFGTTGRLRFSNLLMYDRQTESWWQQASGQAIIGGFTGTGLVARPAAIISWAAFQTAYPNGRVLSRETGYDRSYGNNPYAGYDDVNQPPFLYRGPPIPGQLPAVARILALMLDGEAVAYPFDVLKRLSVVNDTVGGTQIVVFWRPGTASPLDDTTVAGGRDVGAATAFQRVLDGQMLTFQYNGTQITDQETGSVWDGLGLAISGPLAGKSLTPVIAVNSFWFAWVVFQPNTRVYQPAGTFVETTTTPGRPSGADLPHLKAGALTQ